MIASTSSCGSLEIGDNCRSLVTGGNGRVGGFRMSDSCERLVVFEGREAGVIGTHLGKCCLIFASVRCWTLLVSDSSAVAMSV